jgi:hypothetical protein
MPDRAQFCPFVWRCISTTTASTVGPARPKSGLSAERAIHGSGLRERELNGEQGCRRRLYSGSALPTLRTPLKQQLPESFRILLKEIV